MSELQQAVDEYLAIRRALGYKLHETGALLQQCLQFLESEGAEFITTALALRWATQPAHVQPAHWARRLSIVRSFAQYRCASDPRTEIPAADLLPHRVHRPCSLRARNYRMAHHASEEQERRETQREGAARLAV